MDPETETAFNDTDPDVARNFIPVSDSSRTVKRL
jgi:hypothetical protein